MSLLIPPEPLSWSTTKRSLTRITWIFVAFIVAGGWFGADRLLLHDYPGTFVGLGFVIPILLGLIAMQLVARGHTSLRVARDSTGTALRPDRAFSILMLVMLCGGIAWALIVGYFALTNQLDLTGFRGGKFGLLGLTSFIVIGGVAGLLNAWRRGGIGYVKLTPSGIDIADIRSTQTVGWNDVIAVDDHSEINKKTRKAIVLRLKDDTEKTIDGADFYVPKGTGLYWMVRHYWRHPDDRQELTDERALARLNDGNFDVT